MPSTPANQEKFIQHFNQVSNVLHAEQEKDMVICNPANKAENAFD